MQALWNSVKENVNCRSKLTTAVSLPEKYSTLKENPDKRFQNSFSHSINKELKIGDPARNITEMIFKRVSTNPSKQPTRKITKVLRVKNSTEVLERFEKYRDKVKELSQNQQKTHPRSKVDGNELMLFYGTTIACSNKRSRRVSELCRDNCCRVCRIIKSNFDTEYNKNCGIKLSTHTDQFIDDPFSLLKVKIKRAVIICRIIAGTVVNSAILPCFVIVFTSNFEPFWNCFLDCCPKKFHLTNFS